VFVLYRFWGRVSVGFYLTMVDTLPSDSFAHIQDRSAFAYENNPGKMLYYNEYNKCLDTNTDRLQLSVEILPRL
jgi:hypothetical protein